MKIVRRDFIRDGPGSVKMVPIDPEDLWCVYNLIAPGDSVMAATVRKVLREAASGGRDAERVKVKLEIVVENVDYDKVGSILRIRGKNILENEYVKIGAFHTLELELHRPFVLRKEVWDTMARDILQQAADPTASADVAVVLMHEGLAHILLVGKSVTTTRARIETSIPRKHGPAVAGYEKALNKFFNNIMEAFLKHVDFNVIRCAVFASPGFTKDQFHKYLLLEAERKQLRPIIENKSRIVLVHTTSGFKHSLKEVLEAPDVMNVIKDTKAAQEVRVLKEFFDMLSNDQTRACYGPKHVEVAHERMAVQTLLITDELFRSSDVTTRKKYVNLVESVKDSRGTVHVFSSMHVSGELSQEIRQESALHHYARRRLLQRIKTHQGFDRLISNSHNRVLIIFSSSPEQDRTGNFDTEFPMSILFKVSSFLSTANEDIIISFMELKFERSTDEYSIALCSSQDTLEFLLPCFEILLPWFLLSVITALTLPFSCAFNISLRIV